MISKLIITIGNALIERQPFVHTYVERIFPDYYYKQLIENLPDDSAYTNTTYKHRRMVDIDVLGGFWAGVAEWMLSKQFCEAVCSKFDIDSRVVPKARLIRDSEKYSILPHTDIPNKLVSLLFYLPSDERMLAAGTSLYVPKTPITDTSRRHDFALFNKVKTAPFAPNSMFGLKRSECSWHGVERLELGVRNVLLYNINIV